MRLYHIRFVKRSVLLNYYLIPKNKDRKIDISEKISYPQVD